VNKGQEGLRIPGTQQAKSTLTTHFRRHPRPPNRSEFSPLIRLTPGKYLSHVRLPYLAACEKSRFCTRANFHDDGWNYSTSGSGKMASWKTKREFSFRRLIDVFSLENSFSFQTRPGN
jgi:hypothetical protein